MERQDGNGESISSTSHHLVSSSGPLFFVRGSYARVTNVVLHWVRASCSSGCHDVSTDSKRRTMSTEERAVGESTNRARTAKKRKRKIRTRDKEDCPTGQLGEKKKQESRTKASLTFDAVLFGAALFFTGSHIVGSLALSPIPFLFPQSGPSSIIGKLIG